MNTDMRASCGISSTSTDGMSALIFTTLAPGLRRTVSAHAATSSSAPKPMGKPDDAARSQQPLHMVAHAKHRHAALGLMNAQEIERQRTALQALRQHMHRGVLPGNELAVAPDDSLAHRATTQSSRGPASCERTKVAKTSRKASS